MFHLDKMVSHRRRLVSHFVSHLGEMVSHLVSMLAYNGHDQVAQRRAVSAQ